MKSSSNSFPVCWLFGPVSGCDDVVAPVACSIYTYIYILYIEVQIWMYDIYLYIENIFLYIYIYIYIKKDMQGNTTYLLLGRFVCTIYVNLFVDC